MNVFKKRIISCLLFLGLVFACGMLSACAAKTKINNIVGIELVESPKTSYYYDQELNLDDLKIQINYKNADPKVLSYKDIQDSISVSGYDKKKLGSQTLTATYTVSEKKDTFVGSVEFVVTVSRYESSLDFTSSFKDSSVYNGSKVSVSESDYSYTGNGSVVVLWFAKGSNTPLSEAPTNAGDYEVLLKADATESYTAVETAKHDYRISKQVVAAPVYTESNFSYTAEELTAVVSTDDRYTISGDKATLAGSYKATVTLKDTANFVWAEGAQTEFDWVIAKQEVNAPVYTESNFSYTGSELQALISEDSRYTIAGDKGTLAGSYKVVVELKDSANYVWAEGAQTEFDWVIAKQVVAAPVYTESNFSYTGEELTAVISEDSRYTISGDKGTLAGSYKATVTLKDTANFVWAEGAKTEFDWVIAKQVVAAPVYTESNFSYTGEELTAVISEDSRYTISGDKGTLAGSYKATVTLKDTANFVWAEGAKTEFDWAIAKQVVAAPVYTESNFSYTGSELTAVVSADDRYTIAGDKGTLAGSYKATVTLKDTANFVWAEGAKTEFDWAIAKQVVAAPVCGYHDGDFIYDGTLKIVPISTDERYTISGDRATDRGSYTAVVTLKDTNNYVWAEGAVTSFNWAISVATGTLVLDENFNLNKVYDNTPVRDVVEADYVKNGDGNVIVTWFVRGSEVALASKPVNAGLYTVKVLVEGTNNFTQISATHDFEISKADYNMTLVSFIDGSKVYDSTLLGLVVTGELPTGLDGIQLGVDYSEGLVNIGTKEIIATFNTTSTNYNVPSSMSAILRVTPREIGLSWTEFSFEELVYNGEAKVVTATATNVCEGDSVLVDVTLFSGNNIKAGTFTFAAVDISNANYKLPENVYSPEYTITPKPVGLSWTGPEDLVYDGGLKTASVVATGVIDGDTVLVYIDNNDRVILGTLKMKATGLSNANYELPENVYSPEYTITPRVLELEWTAPEDLVYSGEAKVPTVRGLNIVEGDLESFIISVELYPEDDNVNVGSFRYHVTGINSEYYVLGDNVVSPTYTIIKAKVSTDIALSDLVIPYDASSHNLTIKESTLYTVETNDLHTDKGEYSVIITLNDFDNYEWDIVVSPSYEVNDETLTITMKIVTSLGQVNIVRDNFNKVFDGTRIPDLTEEDYTVFGDGAISVFYKLVDDESWTLWTENNGPINAGNYLLKVEMAETENVSEASATKEFTITRKSIQKATINCDTLEFTYNHQRQHPTVLSIVLDGVTLVEGIDYTLNLQGYHAGTNSFYVDAKGNYQHQVRVDYVINPLDINDLVFEVENYTFDGDPHTLHITSIKKDDLVFDFNTYFDIENILEEHTNAGTYHYTVTSKRSPEVSGSKNISFEIAPKDIEFAIQNQNGVYNGTAHTTTLTHTELVGDDELSYTLQYGDNVNAGTCTVTIDSASITSGIASNYNLITGDVEGTIVIAPKDIIVEIVDKLDGEVFNGFFHINEVTHTPLVKEDEKLEYELGYSDNKNAGTHEVTITNAYIAEGNPNNYNIIATDTGIIKIDPKPIVFSINSINEGLVFNGNPHTTTAVHTELVGDDTLEYVLEYSDNVNAGTCRVTIKSVSFTPESASNNYKLDTTCEGTLVIGRMEVTLTVVDIDNTAYTGSRIETTATHTPMIGTDEVEYELAYNNEPIKAGTYNVTISSANVKEGFGLATNYNFIYEDQGSIFISQKQLTIDPNNGPQMNPLVYNGTNSFKSSITDWGTLVGVCEGDDIVLDIDNMDAIVYNKNAGTTTLTINYQIKDLYDNSKVNNYFMPEPFSQEVTIATAPLTVSLTFNTKTYDGTNNVKDSLAALGLVTSGLMPEDYYVNVSLNTATTEDVLPGEELVVTATFTKVGEGSDNYHFVEPNPNTYTINVIKATPSITFHNADFKFPEGFTINSSYRPLKHDEYVSKYGNATIRFGEKSPFSDEFSYEGSMLTLSNEGAYRIEYTVAGNNCYNARTFIIDIEVVTPYTIDNYEGGSTGNVSPQASVDSNQVNWYKFSYNQKGNKTYGFRIKSYDDITIEFFEYGLDLDTPTVDDIYYCNNDSKYYYIRVIGGEEADGTSHDLIELFPVLEAVVDPQVSPTCALINESDTDKKYIAVKVEAPEDKKYNVVGTSEGISYYRLMGDSIVGLALPEEIGLDYEVDSETYLMVLEPGAAGVLEFFDVTNWHFSEYKITLNDTLWDDPTVIHESSEFEIDYSAPTRYLKVKSTSGNLSIDLLEYYNDTWICNQLSDLNVYGFRVFDHNGTELTDGYKNNYRADSETHYYIQLGFNRNLKYKFAVNTAAELPDNGLEGTSISFDVDGEETVTKVFSLKTTDFDMYLLNSQGQKIDMLENGFNITAVKLNGDSIELGMDYSYNGDGQYTYLFTLTTSSSMTPIDSYTLVIVTDYNSEYVQMVNGIGAGSMTSDYMHKVYIDYSDFNYYTYKLVKLNANKSVNILLTNENDEPATPISDFTLSEVVLINGRNSEVIICDNNSFVTETSGYYLLKVLIGTTAEPETSKIRIGETNLV